MREMSSIRREFMRATSFHRTRVYAWIFWAFHRAQRQERRCV